jgi:hypothetical protein
MCIGFALVDMPRKRFAICCHPMRRSDFLMALASSRLIMMVIEALLGFEYSPSHARFSL